MLANDLKKGDRVVLDNGWLATIEDNKKGNIRMATVEGFVTEMGSIYIWDIQALISPGSRATAASVYREAGRAEMLEEIELTPKQAKHRDNVKAMGF